MTNFIYEGHINHALCDKIIEFHKNSDIKSFGLVGNDKKVQFVDKNIKDSIDVVLNSDEILYDNYVQELKKNMESYIEIYPTCNFYSPFGLSEVINVQHYKPGGGYKTWHTERTKSSGYNSKRHLVFMTYLNDVEDGGGTEFWNQGLTVQARKGKTLIWPADWTHTHRGVVSHTQEKYIVTGWLSYLDEKDAEI